MLTPKTRKVIGIILVILVFVILEFLITYYFFNNHFLSGTKIGGVDCSFMSITSAKEKVERAYQNQTCKLLFATGDDHKFYLNEMGVEFNEKCFETVFNAQHENRKEPREYEIAEIITVDPFKVEDSLKQIPQLQEENMYAPEDARIEWNGEKFYIKDAVYGNRINFQEAVNFVTNTLQEGKFEISLYSITDILPDVFEKDLKTKEIYMNSILQSSIRFQLSNGEEVILDYTTIATWVTNDSEGYVIDIENGISTFVDELAIKVDQANSELHFIPADSDKKISVTIPEEMRVHLDKEKQKEEIAFLLGSSKTIDGQLFYDSFSIESRMHDRIEVDITRQGVWGFKKNELLVNTECVTGKKRDGYDTPVGIYVVGKKAFGAVLEGLNKDGSKYSQPVKYWIPFFKGYGIHDASWRYKFGGNIYINSGSHGCVNVPEWAAEIIYNNFDEGTLVIVYES